MLTDLISTSATSCRFALQSSQLGEGTSKQESVQITHSHPLSSTCNHKSLSLQLCSELNSEWACSVNVHSNDKNWCTMSMDSPVYKYFVQISISVAVFKFRSRFQSPISILILVINLGSILLVPFQFLFRFLHWIVYDKGTYLTTSSPALIGSSEWRAFKWASGEQWVIRTLRRQYDVRPV